MKKIYFPLFSIFVLFLLHSTLSLKLKAVAFEYPEYNVEVIINNDSSFSVKEEVIYKVYGDFHGLRRDLTLSNPDRDRLCTTTSNLYCGGFDRVVVNNVKDLNGNDITNKINLYKVEDEDTNKESLRFEWEIFPNGEQQNGEEFGWVLDYTVYGGIASIENSPYFYWNILPEEKSGTVDSSSLKIKFPSNIEIDRESLEVFTDIRFNSNISGNTLNIGLRNIPSYAPFTVAYKFNPNDIQLPGQISYTIAPAFSTQVFLDNINITDQVDGLIKSVPVGEHELRFEHVGYETVSQKVNVESQKTIMVEVNLTPHPFMQFLLLINNIICLIGCLFIPLGLISVYFYYRKNGRDKDMPKTIIPLFNPPTNARPYLVGSLVDEQVDKQDIVGSIIDLAYRGYLKIKEVEKDKNYELTKLEGKTNDSGLNEIETQLFNAIFKNGDVIETKDLGITFPMDYIRLQDKIYKEMVNEGYFNKSPRSTIGIFLSLGILIFILGLCSTILISLFLISFLGILTVFTPGIVIACIGIALIVSAKYMPAKTAKGSKLYAEILGFKMYMNTAERYTVQNIEPEDFVKYLGYAIVFGIEKQWANKFQDIYKGVPEWYQGTGDIYDAIWISSFARSFSNSTVQSMTPISTNSSWGSGWSGSGSFGGFSGGGGGGGSSGGW